MSLIVLRVPGGGLTGGNFDDGFDALPYVAGECAIDGYNYMILAERVEWQTQIAEDKPNEVRRSVHSPTIDCVKISRHVDRATSRLTKMALGAQITDSPWELYFLRVLGDNLAMEALNAAARSIGLAQGRVTRFMTMRLYDPLISKYDFSFDESLPTENIEVSASAIEWIYHLTDSAMAESGVKTIRYDVQKGVYTQPWFID